MDENGYRIVPKYKNNLLEKFGIMLDHTRTPGKGFAKLPEDIYEVIDVKKGDILIHESALLHQGFCKKERLHYHLRHIRNDQLIDKIQNKLNFNEHFLADYDLESFDNINSYKFFNKKSYYLKFIRFKTLLFYFLPRFKSIFNNFFKKEKQSIFHSTIWQ